MSMLAVTVTASAVLFAADSRQFPSGEDGVQKVFLVGTRALLGHSGVGIIPGDDDSRWDAAAEVGRIAGGVPAVAPREKFAFITRDLLQSLNAGLAKRSLPIGRNDVRLTIMFVSRDPDGTVYLARQEFRVFATGAGEGKFRHHAEAQEPSVIIDSLRAKAGLWWDAPSECPVMRMPTAPTPAAFTTFINGVGGQSTECSRLIGGRIRVATIDRNGARWLQP
jgi:hypothetical protein